MNMKAQKPLPKANINVDLSDAETMICEECGNKVFLQGYVIKKISAIISTTGQEVIAPIQVFNCGSCGEMLDLGGEMSELI